MAASQSAAGLPELPPEEVLFLIARTLEAGPLAHLGAQLAREAAERGLLPSRTDVLGAPRGWAFVSRSCPGARQAS